MSMDLWPGSAPKAEVNGGDDGPAQGQDGQARVAACGTVGLTVGQSGSDVAEGVGCADVPAVGVEAGISLGEGIYEDRLVSLGNAGERGFFYPNYTSINRVAAASSGERSVITINETSHLRGTGLPMGLFQRG